MVLLCPQFYYNSIGNVNVRQVGQAEQARKASGMEERIVISVKTAQLIYDFLKGRPYREVNGYLAPMVSGSEMDISPLLEYLSGQPWEQVAPLFSMINQDIALQSDKEEIAQRIREEEDGIRSS